MTVAVTNTWRWTSLTRTIAIQELHTSESESNTPIISCWAQSSCLSGVYALASVAFIFQSIVAAKHAKDL